MSMLTKITTDIYVVVENDEQAEEAAHTINGGLRGRMEDFPEGNVVLVEVQGAAKVSDEEAEEKGLVE